MKRAAYFSVIAACSALCLFVWLVVARDGKSDIVFEQNLIYGKAGGTDLFLNQGA